MDAKTPATQPFPGGDPIQDNPVDPANPAEAPTQVNPVNPTHTQANPDQPAKAARPKGPNASAVVLGVVSLVLAGLVIANETMTWHVDWSGLGPGAIVVIGAVLLAVGAIGLIRRHDDA